MGKRMTLKDMEARIKEVETAYQNKIDGLEIRVQAEKDRANALQMKIDMGVRVLQPDR